MNTDYFDISRNPIKLFLDTVDSVLNSNTFLLKFELKTENMNLYFSNFIHSESFITQISDQDKERKWFNMHDFDYKTKMYKLRKGKILKDKFELEIKEIEEAKKEYLIGMLTGDTTKGRFNSFYSKQIKKEKAKAIVDNLISDLSLYANWKLFFVEPNFLKDALENNLKNKALYYFEGDFANDTATIILTKGNGYLLLTNGID
jgi:hypothetical protein